MWLPVSGSFYYRFSRISKPVVKIVIDSAAIFGPSSSISPFLPLTHPHPPLPPPRNEPINSWLIMNSRIDDWLIKDRRWDRFKRRWQLRSVIERPMFAAHPLATALSGRSVIAAAAARWRHPTRGAQFEPEFESEEVVGRQTQRRCRQEDANAQCVSHRFVNWFTSLICS